MRIFLADRVGFEPTSRLRDYLISSQGRYDHFDTYPYIYNETIIEQKLWFVKKKKNEIFPNREFILKKSNYFSKYEYRASFFK